MDVGSREWRRSYGRLKDGHCYRHDLPITPSLYFDGGTCPLGCKSLNVVREFHLRRFREEARYR